MQKEAIIIIGHGSKSAHAVSDFESIVQLVAEKLQEKLVKGAHMELAEPSIADVVTELWNQGYKQYKFVPYFLYNGNHIKQDIPTLLEELKSEYNGLQYTLAEPIGFDPLMADILIKRCNQI